MSFKLDPHHHDDLDNGIDIEFVDNDILVDVNSDVTAIVNDPDGNHRPVNADDDKLSASERDFVRATLRGITADWTAGHITDDDVVTAIRELIDYCSGNHVLNGNDVANWPAPFYPSYVVTALNEHSALN
jgi:hypothetical protein